MGERTWRILDLFSGDRRHGDPQKVSGDGGENGKLNSMPWILLLTSIMQVYRMHNKYILTLRKPNCRPKKMSPQTLSQQQWLNLEVKSYPSSKTEAIQVTATSMQQKIRIQWVFRRSRRVTRRNFELEENFGLARPDFCRLRSRFWLS